MNGLQVKKFFLEVLETIIGSLIMAISVSLFLLPNELSSGGFSGLATILYYLFNLPMGTTILILNVPLFILATFKIGKGFFVKSMIGTISLSFFIDVLKLNIFFLSLLQIAFPPYSLFHILSHGILRK